MVWDLVMEQWAPFATLNAIGASGTENTGFAVDAFDASRFGILECDVAVRDQNAELWRIGYQVTWVLRLNPIPRGPG
jgi:hypothetical protein